MLRFVVNKVSISLSLPLSICLSLYLSMSLDPCRGNATNPPTRRLQMQSWRTLLYTPLCMGSSCIMQGILIYFLKVLGGFLEGQDYSE